MLTRVMVCLGAGMLLSGGAFGQSTQTVPPAFDAVAGSAGNSIPLGNYTSGTFQVIYGADQLAGIPVGSVITGMQLRLDRVSSSTFPAAPLTITRYDVKMATSALTPATMSSTFASNMLNPVQVRSGSLSLAAGAYQWISTGAGVPEPWGPVIPFTTGYPYTGGPLVVEIRMVSPSNTFSAYADIGVTPSARYMHQDGNADAVTALTRVPTNGGPVVRLMFTPPPVNLAKGVTKVITNEERVAVSGTVGQNTLIQTNARTHMMVSNQNQFDTIGPGSDFVGLSWRLYGDAGASWPAAVANFTKYDVQLSRSQNPPGALSTTIANNVGADAVTVRSGAMSVPVNAFGARGSEATASFGFEVGFATPYQYRSGPLLSVIRHDGQASGTAELLDCTFASDAGYNSIVQAFRDTSSSTAVVASVSSGGETTRYSVDAGTISPLNQLAPTPGNSGLTMTPLYQTVLSASELKYIPVGSVINSLWLRQAPAVGAGPGTNVTALDFELTVSSATAQPQFMSTTAAANEGADKVLVYDGPLVVAAGTMPAGSNGNFGKIVQFQKQFVYKGGPLCVTMRHTGLSGALGEPEAVKGTIATNRSIYDFGVGASTGSFLGGSYTGTAMKLGYIPSVMTPNSLATAEGNSGWNMPFISNYTVQTIIPASQLRTVDIGSAITGLSLRGDSVSSGVFPATGVNLTKFDVSIAPAARSPLAISTNFADNIGAGAVLVRSGALAVPANAYPNAGAPRDNAWYVSFSRAYVYTGGDLCVTLRGDGAVAPTGNYFDGQSNTPIAEGASIYNYVTSTATSGDKWGPLAIRLAFTPRAFCPWDLNNDGAVDDADFSVFIGSYNTLDCTDVAMAAGCPADFNYDRVVDDTDFVLFLAAYNTLLCP
ncbi:MAG: hypothetical protein U0570_03785 [Phycisphaerales bacterium]